MKVSLNSAMLEKKLTNIVNYSFGFLEGAQKGKRIFLNNLGESIIETLANYIDTNARMNTEALHHVYEWYQTGSPAARLFDLNYTISNVGLSVKSSFKQSNSIKANSNVPFYDKARIMENGIPVTITPKKSKVLVFNDGGETVFVSKPVKVNNPGGPNVQGSYQAVFDSFFRNYFTQAFLKSSGLFNYIENPVIYKKNFAAGAKGGKAVGQKAGYTWIINAKIGAN